MSKTGDIIILKNGRSYFVSTEIGGGNEAEVDSDVDDDDRFNEGS
jgi:hypothetical protein